MDTPFLIEHHHNSRMFRCECGKLHVWSRYDGPHVNPVYDPNVKYYEFVCSCYRVHVKYALNFRGEGKI